MSQQLHVFVGHFASHEDAARYALPQWEPEPGEDVSDEEYSAWEDRNPVWALRADLQTGLDPDFVEVIHGDDRYDSLNGYLIDPSDIKPVREAGGNTVVLVFPAALHDRTATLTSTPELTYCGAYDFRWA